MASIRTEKDFLSDEGYCDLIELCICRCDKFGSSTFFSSVAMAEHVEQSCMQNGVTLSVDSFPVDIGEKFIDELFSCEDGDFDD